MKFCLILFCTLMTTAGFSQKEKVVVTDAHELKAVVISSDEVYEIQVKTAPVNKITIKTKAEGEYYDNIYIELEEKGEVLLLKSHYPKILQSGYDKLSAHKVFSMAIEVEIPEGLELNITSNLATVYLDGIFSKVLIELKSGSCFMKNFTGDAVVNTFSGDIQVGVEDAFIEASSRNGKVEFPSFNGGSNVIKLRSINGNIHVEKTK